MSGREQADLRADARDCPPARFLRRSTWQHFHEESTRRQAGGGREQGRAAASIGHRGSEEKGGRGDLPLLQTLSSNQSADSERVVRTLILLPVVSWTLRGDHTVQVPGRITMHEMRGDRLHHPDPAVICLYSGNNKLVAEFFDLCRFFFSLGPSFLPLPELTG